MTTMYLVTDGSYSDYRVLGVYDTKEKAETAKLIYNADNDIEEFELNAIPETPPGLLAWFVWMDRDGAAEARRVSPLGRDDADLHPFNSGFGPKRGMCGYCYAEDEKHAIKIINERRIAYLAMGTWEEDWDVWHKKRLSNRAG